MYCEKHGRSFPDAEFERDKEDRLVHTKPKRHLTVEKPNENGLPLPPAEEPGAEPGE